MLYIKYINESGNEELFEARTIKRYFKGEDGSAEGINIVIDDDRSLWISDKSDPPFSEIFVMNSEGKTIDRYKF